MTTSGKIKTDKGLRSLIKSGEKILKYIRRKKEILRQRSPLNKKYEEILKKQISKGEDYMDSLAEEMAYLVQEKYIDRIPAPEKGYVLKIEVSSKDYIIWEHVDKAEMMKKVMERMVQK